MSAGRRLLPERAQKVESRSRRCGLRNAIGDHSAGIAPCIAPALSRAPHAFKTPPQIANFTATVQPSWPTRSRHDRSGRRSRRPASRGSSSTGRAPPRTSARANASTGWCGPIGTQRSAAFVDDRQGAQCSERLGGGLSAKGQGGSRSGHNMRGFRSQLRPSIYSASSLSRKEGCSISMGRQISQYISPITFAILFLTTRRSSSSAISSANARSVLMNASLFLSSIIMRRAMSNCINCSDQYHWIAD